MKSVGFFNQKGHCKAKSYPNNTLLSICIRQATLDAFWSQEDQQSYPIGLNLFDSTTIIRFTLELKLHAYQPEGSGHISIPVTNSLWFKRFTGGCHCRLGNVWLPDNLVTLEIMDAAFEILEERWDNRFFMILSSFYGISRVNLLGILKYWEDATDRDNLQCHRYNGSREHLMPPKNEDKKQPSFHGQRRTNVKATMFKLNIPFHKLLKEAQCLNSLLIDSKVVVKDSSSTAGLSEEE
eukprot:jgi/Psemu1/19513/gm1.19513_g